MDLSKVFNSIPHDLIIATLQTYGIHENALVLLHKSTLFCGERGCYSKSLKSVATVPRLLVEIVNA